MKIALIIVVVLALAVPAGLYFAGMLPIGAAEAAEESEGSHEEHKEPYYLTLDPPFVVNFMHRGTLRYLQLSLDLMYYDAHHLDTVKARMPAVRNDLILLLSRQEFELLSTPEGKELLRDQIMVAVNKVLEIDPAVPANEGEVYITNFVMQ